MTLRRLAFSIVLVAALASAAGADVVRLKDGSVLEGTVLERDGKVVVVIKKGVEVEVDPAQVVSIERSPALRDELERRRKELVPGDPDVLHELAQWCKRVGLASERREILEAVLRLAPDHAQARADLGFVKDGGKWIQESELRRKLGYERVQGRWIPADEARRLRRQEELRKLLLAASFKLKKADLAAGVRAELDALKDPPDLLGPLLEERLDDHDASVRRTFVELIAKLKRKESAPALLRTALQDDDASVRAAAATGLWASGDMPSRTELVQGLFAKSALRRERAAEALGTIADPDTVPYLIEGLEIRTLRRAQEVEESASVQRGYDGAGLGLGGPFGLYHEPVSGVSVSRVREGWVIVDQAQRPALVALQKITGRDFSTSKPDWFAWWKKEGRAKLAAKAPAK